MFRTLALLSCLTFIAGCGKLFAKRGEDDLAAGERAERGETKDNPMMHYNRAIDANPREPHYFEVRGNLYAKRGDCGHAVLDFSHALAMTAKIGPGSLYLARARCRTMLGDFAEAVHDYSLGLMENPNDAQLYGGIALNELLREKPAEALAAIDKATELAPSDLKLRFDRAVLLARIDRQPEAGAIFSTLEATRCANGKSIAFDWARENERARTSPLIRLWQGDELESKSYYQRKCDAP